MIKKILKKYWGYDDFRPLQEDIILSVLDGKDTLGLLPTGGGKSLTFQVPAMLLPGITLVITPLISLMKDQVDNLLQRHIRAYALHSGLSRSEIRLIIDRCRLSKVKLLYISPERLQSVDFITELRNWDISLIVVDEAHCISQWGYDFRPSYLKIQTIRKVAPNANVLALTASATPEVTADIMKQLLFRQDYRLFVKSFERENLSYIVRYDEYKERTLLQILKSTVGSTIVYVRSRRRCRELAVMLDHEGISTSFYHAGLDPEDKAEKQDNWKKDKVRVMVATNAFGMGIDKPDVRLVIHFDLPSSLEEYYQEAGRAGRDRLPSYAVAIVAQSDKALLTRRLNDAFPPKEYIVKAYELLGNFLDVAVGDGYNQTYEFNFDLFCTRFQLQGWLVYSSLKILTRAGYIEFVDEIQTRSRTMITVPKTDFYNLNLDDHTDAVFSALQREYTGLFADFVYIDEHVLARRAEMSENDVYQALLKLARMHVLTYIPKKSCPYIYYTTSREEPKYILLPKEVYEDRKQRMAQRIDAVKRFAFDNTQCRAVTILEYFGEKNLCNCGRCDVCRDKRLQPYTRKEQKDIETFIRKIIDQPITDILAQFPKSRHKEVIEIIRQINDE